MENMEGKAITLCLGNRPDVVTVVGDRLPSIDEDQPLETYMAVCENVVMRNSSDSDDKPESDISEGEMSDDWVAPGPLWKIDDVEDCVGVDREFCCKSHGFGPHERVLGANEVFATEFRYQTVDEYLKAPEIKQYVFYIDACGWVSIEYALQKLLEKHSIATSSNRELYTDFDSKMLTLKPIRQMMYRYSHTAAIETLHLDMGKAAFIWMQPYSTVVPITRDTLLVRVIRVGEHNVSTANVTWIFDGEKFENIEVDSKCFGCSTLTGVITPLKSENLLSNAPVERIDFPTDNGALVRGPRLSGPPKDTTEYINESVAKQYKCTVFELHGGVGVGKTTLSNAIRCAAMRNPNVARVFYVKEFCGSFKAVLQERMRWNRPSYDTGSFFRRQARLFDDVMNLIGSTELAVWLGERKQDHFVVVCERSPNNLYALFSKESSLCREQLPFRAAQYYFVQIMVERTRASVAVACNMRMQRGIHAPNLFQIIWMEHASRKCFRAMFDYQQRAGNFRFALSYNTSVDDFIILETPIDCMKYLMQTDDSNIESKMKRKHDALMKYLMQEDTAQVLMRERHGIFWKLSPQLVTEYFQKRAELYDEASELNIVTYAEYFSASKVDVTCAPIEMMTVLPGMKVHGQEFKFPQHFRIHEMCILNDAMLTLYPTVTSGHSLSGSLYTPSFGEPPAQALLNYLLQEKPIEAYFRNIRGYLWWAFEEHRRWAASVFDDAVDLFVSERDPSLFVTFKELNPREKVSPIGASSIVNETKSSLLCALCTSLYADDSDDDNAIGLSDWSRRRCLDGASDESSENSPCKRTRSESGSSSSSGEESD